MSSSVIEPYLSECADWNIFDANVYVGHSGIKGELALEAPELLQEMDRFAIKRALVSHFTGLEYDSVLGNDALVRDADVRFTPAWTVTPDPEAFADLLRRNPNAVRLWFATSHHSFSSAAWCAGDIFSYLEEKKVLVLISRPDIEWNDLADILENFPRMKILLTDIGYRADRYIFPLLRKYPNLHFDTSMYLSHRQLEWYLNTYGADRVVFGSKLPLYTPGSALTVLGTCRIPDSVRLAVAGGNLRRLLGVSA